MQEVKEKRMAADQAKVNVFQMGDLVWVRSVTHRRLNWLPGVIESAVPSVSYRVLCNNHVRQVSSYHLRRRSEDATCLEVDPSAVDGEPSTVENYPTPGADTTPTVGASVNVPTAGTCTCTPVNVKRGYSDNAGRTA
jgi:hypothetical protein